MKISAINTLPNIYKPPKINTRNTNPISKSKLNLNKTYNLYLGQDLVSFKSKNFTKTLDYFKLPKGCTPDVFQIEAGENLLEGKNVLVEAPTGTGKTAIAHYAISKNLKEGKKTFYTTPLKALSNQKLNEMKKAYGEENIGILTGDRKENAEAPIIVMTTEVYRNMALANAFNDKNPILDNVGTVIFDEFHYMDDYSRGGVWEDSLMFTPNNIQTLSLSATIGNTNSINKWLNNINKVKETHLVALPESARSVPLEFNFIKPGSFYDDEKKAKKSKEEKQTDNEQKISSKPSLSDYKFALNKMKSEDRLPAIFFVFSKSFSKDLMEYFVLDGQDLTTDKEKAEIKQIIAKYEKDDKFLGCTLNKLALEKGFAVHNAGIIPEQKELIEELFQKKLLKVVIATETLAAGINMPAKSILMSRPFKPSNEKENKSEYAERMLTPNEFKQMGGRAGRRGIDTIGYVDMLVCDKASEQAFTTLKDSECNPITSKYDPDYEFLTKYYKHNQNNEMQKQIFEKTFFVNAAEGKERKTKLNELLDISQRRTNVLVEKEFLTKVDDKLYLTPEGEMASKIQGHDALSLIETIKNQGLKNIKAEELAAFVGLVANPATHKEDPIVSGKDLTYEFEESNKNIPQVKQRMETTLNALLKRFGKELSDFNDFEELNSFINELEAPKKSEEEVKTRLDELTIIKKKLYKIKDAKKNYTPTQIAQKLKFQETISTATLKSALEDVEMYKLKHVPNGWDVYIDKIEKQLSAVEETYNQSSKKAKNRMEKQKATIESNLKMAQCMRYLDENLYSAISSNFEYQKKYDTAELDDEFKKCKEEYLLFDAKETMQNLAMGLESTTQYLESKESDDKEGNAEFQNISNCINRYIRNTKLTNKVEFENGIENPEVNYSDTSALMLYEWALLNKVNPHTIMNWQIINNKYNHIVDEGTIFRRVMQSVDLLNQLKNVTDVALENSYSEEDKNYYTNLKKTIVGTKRLLMQEPVHS